MISGTKVVSLKYRPLREQDDFFPNGRPAVDPVTCEAVLRRPFDIALILLSIIGMSLCILHFIATISNLPPLPTPPENASLPCGLYRGKWSGPYKVLRFYGVPYAIPPLAMPDLTTEELLDEVLAKSARNHRHLRWLSPQPAEGVEGCIISHHDKCTFQKSQWQCNMDRKPAFSFCAQPIPNKQDDFRDADILFSREKCLQLDIATPLYSGSLRPVVVVLAGYQSFAEPLMPPSYREPAYWPSDAAILETDAVWVYVHYRLGVAGFFFDLEMEDTTSAPNDTYDVPFHNFAIEDQMLALKWIKTNIRRFGGDPYRITLLGHGSGATNALALLDLQSRDPQGGRLFNQAWLASGAVNWATSKDQNVPYEILSDLVSKRLGEKCEMKGHIAKTCSGRDLHRALMDDAIAFIYESTKELWNDSRLLGDILSLGAPRGWMYGYGALDLKPPVFWTPEKRANIFSSTKGYENAFERGMGRRNYDDQKLYVLSQLEAHRMLDANGGFEAILQTLEKRLFEEYKPKLWAHYVNDTFVIINQDRINYNDELLNSINPDLQFTMEEEVEDKLPFLDVLVYRQPDDKLATSA
ncbi:hypothetical protein SprV_0200572900 [Sparganum proliferum]